MSPSLSHIEKANTLIEALPWIKMAYGKRIVIKYGGAAMRDAALRKKVAEDIMLMKLSGVHPIIVHGGGPEISELMEKLGEPVKFIDGIRVTSKNAIDIVKMVLIGKVNKDIVNAINGHGAYAVGISGEDGSLLKGEPLSRATGRAGTITQVDTTIIDRLIEDDFIPVIASVGVAKDGEPININADVAAAKLAIALNAEKIIYLSDINGVYQDPDDPSTLISVMTASEAKDFISKSGQVAGGMIPKINSCVEAIEGGVSRAHILNGTLEHSLILEVYTNSGIGTMLLLDEEKNSKAAHADE